MQLLDRYLLREITGPLLLILLVIVMLMVSGVIFELSELLIAKKIPLTIIGQLFLFQFPGAIVEGLPIAVLASVLLALGRFSANNELTIVRASGISLRRCLLPAFLLALVVSLISFYLSDAVVPRANHGFQNMVRRIVLQEAKPEIEQDIFFRSGRDYFFYIGQVDATSLQLQNILVYQLNQEVYPRIITAQSGWIKDGVWYLVDGVLRNIEPDGFTSEEVKFGELRLELEDGLERFFGNQKTTREMSRSELAANIRLFSSSGINIRSFLVDYHLKFAAPLASTAFVLFCTPLVLRFLRLPKQSRLVLSSGAVALTLTYYVLTPFCRSLGINGIIPVFWGAWLPTILFGLCGVIAVIRADSL